MSSTELKALVPGLALAAVATALARVIAAPFDAVSTLVVAVVLGVIIGNSPLGQPMFEPGLTFAAKKILRFGVVLLGLRLSFGDVLDLGPQLLVVVALTVVFTFFGTQWLARRMGLSPGMGLLVATGYSICGASAIAAVEGSTDATEEEVAASVGLVTLFGSLAIVALPAAANLFDLADEQFSIWAGASVHDVAQVVATSSSRGEGAVAQAMVVKLTRVAMLAPIVLGVSVSRRRAAQRAAGSQGAVDAATLPPIVPAFVIGFLIMVAVRTIVDPAESVIDSVRFVEGLALAIALVGLGAGVRLAKLRQLGPTPIVLGLVAWVLVAAVSLVGITLTS